jgi:hypothetical protein
MGCQLELSAGQPDHTWRTFSSLCLPLLMYSPDQRAACVRDSITDDPSKMKVADNFNVQGARRCSGNSLNVAEKGRSADDAFLRVQTSQISFGAIEWEESLHSTTRLRPPFRPCISMRLN